MPSDVPEAREIVALVIKLDCPCQCPQTVQQWEVRRRWLRNLVLPRMKRDPAIRRAPIESDEVTVEIVAKIWELYAANPKMPFRESGRLVGVDGGRVAEAARGLPDGL